MTDNFITVGRIINYWGSSGAVSIELMSDNPTRFSPGSIVFINNAKYTVLNKRSIQSKTVIEFEELGSISAAEALKGALIQIPESELPSLDDSSFYHFELIGLKVISAGDAYIGEVLKVLETGANDVYVVKTDSGELLIPAVKDIIKEINPSKGFIKIEPIEGLLD